MSSFKMMIEMPLFLAPGLCILGNVAYINSMYVAAPFEGVSDKNKDAYKYFHVQLQIKIECSFGMLVHQWTILCIPIPCTFLAMYQF